MGINRDDIALKLDASLREEEQGADKGRYYRAELYKLVREDCQNAKEFRAWLEELKETQRIDHETAIPKMIQIATVLDLDTYLKLGWYQAIILTPKKLWKNPALARGIIEKAIAESWTVKQCKEAIREQFPTGLDDTDTDEGGEDGDDTGPEETTVNPAPSREEVLAENWTLKRRVNELESKRHQWTQEYSTEPEQGKDEQPASEEPGDKTRIFFQRWKASEKEVQKLVIEKAQLENTVKQLKAQLDKERRKGKNKQPSIADREPPAGNDATEPEIPF